MQISTLQQYVHQSRYARWLEKEQRRETWTETVDRYIGFFRERMPEEAQTALNEIRAAILGMRVMPSMRAMMTAGAALTQENVAGYNCAYMTVDSKRAFAEALYILMCGTGVGFSCERQYAQKLPIIADAMRDCDDLIVVEDSRIGWAKAYHRLISHLYIGDIPKVDYSRIRAAGEPLKTFGGRASGPKPLMQLFGNTIALFRRAVGRRFNSMEVHDLMCYIGEVVTVGGVRRSAMISLSNLSDTRMRNAKSGNWWVEAPQRAISNNSVAYTEKPDAEIFMEEWLSLVRSKSGERGVFNRVAAKEQAEFHGRRDPDHEFGCNPCGEIVLRPRQFCNLSEVVVRAEDTIEELREKVRLATIIGTMQATLDEFKFLSAEWQRNVQDERLLGVSMTGIMDHPILGRDSESLPGILSELRSIAIVENAKWAKILDINPATAITCIKPSGTVSQLVDSASGIHPRFADYYLRTVRATKNDPIYRFMKDRGVLCEDEIGREDSGAVFYFPVKAPEGSVTADGIKALAHLRLWLTYRRHWCEHNPSITVQVLPEEWPRVGAWLYDHFEEICGVTFLPRSDHSYQQAPYQQITEAQYEEWLVKHPMPVMTEEYWKELSKYETGDSTVSSQTMACTGGTCELL